MHEEQNLALVRRGYDAFGRGDIATLLTLFDAEISWVTPGPADLPTAGTRHGHAAVAEFFKTLLGLMDVTRFEPVEFIAKDEQVIVIGNETCRVRATGKEVDYRWVHVFTIREGKVTAFEEFGDLSALVIDLRSTRASA